jgi:hypothetical protein
MVYEGPTAVRLRKFHPFRDVADLPIGARGGYGIIGHGEGIVPIFIDRGAPARLFHFGSD